MRWLSPVFQNPGARAHAQATMDVDTDTDSADDGDDATAAPAAPTPKRPWPTGLHAQIKAAAEVLVTSPAPLALPDLEARFSARGRLGQAGSQGQAQRWQGV